MSATKIWLEKDVRELINLVKLNPGLYAKGNKTYKDKGRKNLAWESVGFSLKPPCSGEEAQRKYKSLRDQFNKELKKVVGHQPSGAAGGEKPITSSWEFCGDMEFLSDHIIPRKTHSSMDTSACIELVSESEIDTTQLFVSPSSTAPTSTATSSSDNMTFSGEGSGEDQLSDNVSLTSCASSASAITRGKAARGLVNPTVPKPDNPAARKRKADDAALNALIQTATSVAKVLTERHEEDKTKRNNDVNDLVKSALKYVPEDKYLQCMIDMLKVAEIYRAGGGPCIITDSSKTN